MTLNIITPNPSTIKLEIKVKVFLKLFSLSYAFNRYYTRLLREHVSDGTKLM